MKQLSRENKGCPSKGLPNTEKEAYRQLHHIPNLNTEGWEGVTNLTREQIFRGYARWMIASVSAYANKPTSCYVPIEVTNKRGDKVLLSAMIDSGCAHTAVDPATLQRLGWETRPIVKKDPLTPFRAMGAFNQSANLDQVIDLSFSLWPTNTKFSFTMYEAPLPMVDVLLGSDWLSEFDVVQDVARGSIKWTLEGITTSVLTSLPRVMRFAEALDEPIVTRRPVNSEESDKVKQKENRRSTQASTLTKKVMAAYAEKMGGMDNQELPYFNSVKSYKQWKKQQPRCVIAALQENRSKEVEEEDEHPLGEVYEHALEQRAKHAEEMGYDPAAEQDGISSDLAVFRPGEDWDTLLADQFYENQRREGPHLSKPHLPEGATIAVFTGISTRDLHVQHGFRNKIDLYLDSPVQDKQYIFEPRRDQPAQMGRVMLPAQRVSPRPWEVGESSFQVIATLAANLSCREGEESHFEMPPVCCVGYLTPLPDNHEQENHGQAEEKTEKTFSPLVDYSDLVEDTVDLTGATEEELEAHESMVYEMLKERIKRKDPLSAEQSRAFRTWVNKNHRAFNTFEKHAPARAKISPMNIGVDESKIKKPVYVSRDRHNPKEREVISEHTQLMLDSGAVSPSKSEWAFPVVLVKKADGTLRFCVNYVGLNKVTVPDRYPLPRVAELLQELGGNCYFSSLDCLNAFHQIPLQESDKHYTAFRTHEGLFQFNVCPFGLRNIPSSWQRCIDTVLSGLTGVCCLVYIDDCLVFSKTFEDHLRDLTLVVKRFKDAGLILKIKKCEMLRDEVSFLGFLVTPEGVKADPKKIAPVKDWPKPTNVTELRSFVGFANHYRRYIKDCSVKLAPLTKMCRLAKPGETVNFQEEWGVGENGAPSKADLAFAEMKKALTSTPILRHPDFERPFHIDVDSCELGVGAVLSQKFEVKGKQQWCPIAYFSKKFSAAEVKYPATHLEAIGIIKTLDHFREYIYGQYFTAHTDNLACNLTWLRKKVTGKLGRWSARLAEWDGYMNLDHNAGVNIPHADGLSRMGFAPGEVRPPTLPDALIPGVPLARDQGKRMGPLKFTTKTDGSVHLQRKRARKMTDVSSLMSDKDYRIDANIARTLAPLAPTTIQRLFPSNGRESLDSIPEEPEDYEVIVCGCAEAHQCDQAQVWGDKLRCLPFLPQVTDSFLLQKHADAWKPPLVLSEGGEEKQDPLVEQLRKEITLGQRRDKEMAELRLEMQDLIPQKQEKDYTQYQYKENLLWKKAVAKGEERWLLLVPDPLRYKIVSLFHDRIEFAHLGIGKTYALIKTRFTWPKMLDDIKKYIKTCSWCQKFKSLRKVKAAGLQPKRFSYRNECMSIDIATVDSFGKKYKYVLTMVDCATGFARVMPMRTMSEKEVISHLRDWIVDYDPMKYCLSDNGSQFLGQDFQDFLEAQEILPLHTTKEHAQTNANSERVHRWLKERLAILHATHPGKWYEYIALVVKAHNIAPRSESSVCPREAFLCPVPPCTPFSYS